MCKWLKKRIFFTYLLPYYFLYYEFMKIIERLKNAPNPGGERDDRKEKNAPNPGGVLTHFYLYGHGTNG